MAAVDQSSDLLEGDQRQSKETVTIEESLQDDTQPSKFSWYFIPLYPIYKTLEFSTGCLRKIFLMMEQIMFALLSFFERDYTQHQNDQAKDGVTLDMVLISLFRIWSQAHENLRQSVLYIEKFYEEVVPLIPGQLPPFSAMDIDTMPVRTMCFYATMQMIGRLPHHTVSFISNIFRRIISFLLKPIEDTAIELG